jgi:hypothetical protein
MIESASYTREFEHGTMSGKLGWIERETEEFYYTSESTISSGEWELQSGTGYWEQETSYGDFANGSLSVTNNNDNTTTTFKEAWKQLYGNKELIDYTVEDNEWTIDDETENVVDLLEYLYNDDDSTTIPNNYAAITVNSQTYDDFEDYFAMVNNTGTGNTSIGNASNENNNHIFYIKMPDGFDINARFKKNIYLALESAISKERTKPYDVVIENFRFNILIDNDIAANGIATVEVIREYKLAKDIFEIPNPTQITTIGQFKMELGVNGLPDKNTIEMAKYLISLFKANPQNGIENNILLTNDMTELQVRQLFKQVTNKTAIEDAFINLQQAEIRQEIKDKLDAKIDPLRQYEFYNALGLSDMYNKLLLVISDPTLKIKTPASGTESYYDHKTNTIFLLDGMNTNVSIIAHELVHAYTNNICGGINRVKDEMLATIIQNIVGERLTKPLEEWENLIKKSGVTETELTDGWNALWYIDQDIDKSLPTLVQRIESEYRYFVWQPYYPQYPSLSNLMDLKNIFGVSFSQKTVRNYSSPNLPNNYSLPTTPPPSGYDY